MRAGGLLHPLVTAPPGSSAYYAQIAEAAREVSRAVSRPRPAAALRRAEAPVPPRAPKAPSRPPTEPAVPGKRRCGVCGRTLPIEMFRAKKNGGGHEGRSSDCNQCHKAYNQGLRRVAAESKGRRYRTMDVVRREQRERQEAHLAAVAERERAMEDARRARREMPPAEKERIRRENVKRIVARQRERYNTDPDYHARIKATKIKRKRAIAGALVQVVNREVVAKRDGWRCCICGKRVTRGTWSLDHIKPLSQGGEHSYRNVALAHRRCNSARGVGKLPSQAPLFAQGAA